MTLRKQSKPNMVYIVSDGTNLKPQKKYYEVILRKT